MARRDEHDGPFPVARSAGRPPASWSSIVGVPASTADGRLMRAVAVTFLGTVAILALYFGSAVLIPTAVAVLLAFILNPVVTWLRRLLPLPLAVAVAMIAALACIAVAHRAGHDPAGRGGRPRDGIPGQPAPEGSGRAPSRRRLRAGR